MISPFDSFETTCKTYPDSIAVVFQKRLFTYRELYDKCMSISQLLDQAGVKANTVVAVSMQRSMEMIASILAIMHRKAVFLLLDINQPKRRLQAIISQSKPECILSCNLAGSRTDWRADPSCFSNGNCIPRVYIRVHGKTQRGCNNRSLTGKLHPLFPRYFRITTW